MLILQIEASIWEISLQWDANNNIELNELHEFMSEVDLYDIMPTVTFQLTIVSFIKRTIPNKSPNI
jgi:hypothetical protein